MNQHEMRVLPRSESSSQRRMRVLPRSESSSQRRMRVLPRSESRRGRVRHKTSPAREGMTGEDVACAFPFEGN